MRIFLSVLLFTFSFQLCTKADEISELLIEEMSVGDSLLKYMSIDEINEEFSLTKNHYVYLNKPLKYREAYLYKNFKNYESIQKNENTYLEKEVKKIIYIYSESWKKSNLFKNCVKILRG